MGKQRIIDDLCTDNEELLDDILNLRLEVAFLKGQVHAFHELLPQLVGAHVTIAVGQVLPFDDDDDGPDDGEECDCDIEGECCDVCCACEDHDCSEDCCEHCHRGHEPIPFRPCRHDIITDEDEVA